MKTDYEKKSLIMGEGCTFVRDFKARAGRAVLFCITSIPTLAILFMIIFIAKEALPFFENLPAAREFFTSSQWRPSDETLPRFGALAIFYGTAMVTVGACLIAIPLGITAAVCLSEIVSPKTSKYLKPAVEMLAAIPSVVYGFFAIVILAPILQEYGGAIIGTAILIAGIPTATFCALIVGAKIRKITERKLGMKASICVSACVYPLLFAPVLWTAYRGFQLEISSGTNALNASAILAIMALPTIVSISQDALSAVGRDMREGSLALGATRAETIFKILLPCAKSGIAVAVILGLMRVVGETMVVWMASGNALKIPEPFYNFLEPVRTLTATIAGEMGEADQSTGSKRYHVLFAMSLCLMLIALAFNIVGQRIGRKSGSLKK